MDVVCCITYLFLDGTQGLFSDLVPERLCISYKGCELFASRSTWQCVHRILSRLGLDAKPGFAVCVLKGVAVRSWERSLHLH